MVYTLSPCSLPYMLNAPPERGVATIVMSGPFRSIFSEAWPGARGSLAPAPKLGRVIMLLPPWTETPDIEGLPPPFPAPPPPGYGDVPARAIASEPRPEPSFAEPVPSPTGPLAGPVPIAVPLPPPAPPTPGFAPPEGDMASAPAPPLPGTPTVFPGSF